MMELPLWCKGIGRVLGALGHSFNPWLHTVEKGFDVTGAAAEVTAVAQT